MKKHNPFLLFFPLFFLCFFNKIEGESLINSTCRTAAQDDPNINYTFCYTSLQAAPASRCAGLHGLGSIAIRNLRYNVTDTRCLIKQMLKNPKVDRYVRQCLDVCFELYSDAIDQVKQGMRYFNTNRFNDANVQISAVLDAATTCEDAFSERPGVVSPLTRRNRFTFTLGAMGLSIMNIINHNGELS